MKKIVLVTGGFDPLHSGHIAYIQEARRLGDLLIIGANSDEWLRRKKKKEFMPWNERAAVLSALSYVDRVINFDDSDNSAKDAIRKVRSIYPNDQIIFANGGDRTNANIPEMDINDENLEFIFGVGGEHKMNSSSWILQEWKAPKTERQWGYWRVLHEQDKEVKLKELTVLPGKMLSMQKHKDRAEHWFVADGVATVYTVNVSTDTELHGIYKKFQHIHIDRQEWHQLCNEGDVPLKVIEIQYGENCVEEDIERR